MERVGGRTISATNLWRETQQRGARLEAVMAHRQAALRPEQIVPTNARQDHQHPKGVGLDGGMVHVRGEGWKEFKTGVVYDVGVRPGEDVLTGEPDDLPCAEHMRYTAVLGDVASFAPALWELAATHDLLSAAQTSVTADGAEWIWNLSTDLFPDSAQIIDWYHATQHLAEAARSIYGEATPQYRRWYRQWETKLYLGHVRKLIRALNRQATTKPDKAEAIREQRTYFKNNLKRMNYLEMRMEGYPIGSGMVESAAKQYKGLFCGAGMRWSRLGAERLIPIRSAILSKRFDKMWHLAYNSPPN